MTDKIFITDIYHSDAYADLKSLRLNLPPGFVISDTLYEDFIRQNKFFVKIHGLISTIHYERVDSLMQISNHLNRMITDQVFPKKFIDQLRFEYKKYTGLFKNAELTVDGQYNVKNADDLLGAIKKKWMEKFSPQSLIAEKNSEPSWILKNKPILVQKVITSKKSGKIFTDNPEPINENNLDIKEIKELRDIGKKIKKHFFLPYEITWVIDKNKVYVVDLKPMTNVHKAHLILIRHGRSEYNELGLWAGWDEPPLTKNGKEDVRIAAKALKDIHLDVAYASHLIRHKQTIDVLKDELKRDDLPIIINDAILERNYGDLTRKNKWEIKKQYGDEQFMKWRRGWDVPIPNGESLKDVYDRVIPYYKGEILPKLKSGKNAVIASSGNCLRALVKYLDNISNEDISNLEIATGEVYVYQIDEDGKVVGKEIRNQHENKV